MQACRMEPSATADTFLAQILGWIRLNATFAVLLITENVGDISSTLFTEQTISVSNFNIYTCLTYNSCSV